MNGDADQGKAGMGLRPPVRRLDPRIVAKIAAGEMILRPFSVVKELVENSIDAGAGFIEVCLGDSADQWLTVADDGCGMEQEDLLTALEPHATSKLTCEEDLLRISSLGFRGEAIPSIGRVAKLEIVTAVQEGLQGWRVLVEGGEQRALLPAARARGTTVRVEDLFYNSPVRKRFLKSAESEIRLIYKLLTTCALTFPAVGFRLVHRDEPLLQVAAASALPERIAQLHGPSFLEKILPIDLSTQTVQLQGYVGIPELARPGTQHQTLLVNQRWVTAPWFSAALRQGFGDLLPPNRHPFALLFLTVDPARVDVNVHPTKREIRLLDEQRLFGDVVRAVQAQTKRLVPEWNLDPRDPGSGCLWDREGAAGPGDSPTAFANRDLRPGTRPEAVEENLRLLYAPADPARNSGILREEGADEGQASASSPALPAEPGADAAPSTSGLVPLWQLHQRYLFAQTRQGFLIIDQHAAHERILYERALENLRGTAAATQQLLFPLVLHVEGDEWEAFKEHASDLESLGINAEEFGRNTVMLRGVPLLWDRDPEGRLREVLHELAHSRSRSTQRQQRLAASFACRSAVRSGQSLSLEEMNSLIDQLFATEMPHGDPHGRPTFLQIRLFDLDKRFGRHG